MVFTCGDVSDLTFLEEASIAIVRATNRCKLVPIGQVLRAKPMYPVLSRAARVDVTARRQCQTEVVTAGKLDNSTCRLEGYLSERRVDKIARWLPIFQRLFKDTELAISSQATTVD